MLYVLAWLLWLTYKQRQHNRHEEGQEAVTEENIKKTSTDVDSPLENIYNVPVTEEDVVATGIPDNFEEVKFDFDEADFNFSDNYLQNNDNEYIHEAISLLSQENTEGEDLNISSDDCLETDADEVKQAELLSQESSKRHLAEVKSFQKSSDSLFRSFSPIKAREEEKSNLSNKEHFTSDINFQITQVPSNSRHVGVIDNEVKLAPLKVLIDSAKECDTSLEDDEVKSVFKSENDVHFPINDQSDELHSATVVRGMRVNVKEEPTSKIHSIVVKGKQTYIRCKSPSGRAISPNIKVRSSPVHVNQEDHPSTQPRYNDEVHLLVNTQNRHVEVKSREFNSKNNINNTFVVHDYVKDQVQVEDVHQEPDSLSTCVPDENERRDSDELANTQNKNLPLLGHPTVEYTDFDAIMKKRKNHVDTIDIAATVLGQLGKREKKIGRDKPISKHWLRVREAVHKKQYLFFKSTEIQ